MNLIFIFNILIILFVNISHMSTISHLHSSIHIPIPLISPQFSLKFKNLFSVVHMWCIYDVYVFKAAHLGLYDLWGSHPWRNLAIPFLADSIAYLFPPKGGNLWDFLIHIAMSTGNFIV